MDIPRELQALRRRLRALGKRGGDPWLQKYVGSPYPLLGLSVPQLRGIVRDFAREHRDLDARSLNALAAALWRGSAFEEKSLAIALLDRYPNAMDVHTWRMLDRWVDDAVGWGLCDGLGAGPIAEMVHAQPARFRETLRWTRSTNFWRRRIAAYALRAYVFGGELDRPFQLLGKLLYDPEFWVQRAVGTWLRECWKKNRRRTEAFLRKHAKGLPRVTITVATERAPKAFREELRRRAGWKRAA